MDRRFILLHYTTKEDWWVSVDHISAIRCNHDKEHCDPIYKQLSRWVNNRFVFAKCERFEDYTQKKTETENDPTLWD